MKNLSIRFHLFIFFLEETNKIQLFLEPRAFISPLKVIRLHLLPRFQMIAKSDGCQK